MKPDIFDIAGCKFSNEYADGYSIVEIGDRHATEPESVKQMMKDF